MAGTTKSATTPNGSTKMVTKWEASADAEPFLAAPEGQLDQTNWARGNENGPPRGAASPARSAGPFLRWALAYVRMVVTD